MAITLTKGEKAPEFTAADQRGNTLSLQQYAGNKIILFFYPQDDTPACTANVCNLQSNLETLTNRNLVLIGVSPDDLNSHLAFATKYALQYALIADTNKEILKKYGCWGEKNLYGKIVVGVLRATFIIDERGYIQHIIKRVDTKNAAAQILKFL